MNADEIAREIVDRWTNLDTWGGKHISSRLKPDEAICAIATALRAAESRGYERAREQAAKVADSQFPGDIDDLEETARMYEVGRQDAAAAIRAMQPEDKP